MEKKKTGIKVSYFFTHSIAFKKKEKKKSKKIQVNISSLKDQKFFYINEKQCMDRQTRIYAQLSIVVRSMPGQGDKTKSGSF